eukprot:15791-Heterococcus_DN1.PRE.1
MLALLSVTLTSLIFPAAAPAPLDDVQQHHHSVQLGKCAIIIASQRIVGSAALQLSNRAGSRQLAVALQRIWLKTMAHALQ